MDERVNEQTLSQLIVLAETSRRRGNTISIMVIEKGLICDVTVPWGKHCATSVATGPLAPIDGVAASFHSGYFDFIPSLHQTTIIIIVIILVASSQVILMPQTELHRPLVRNRARANAGTLPSETRLRRNTLFRSHERRATSSFGYRRRKIAVPVVISRTLPLPLPSPSTLTASLLQHVSEQKVRNGCLQCECPGLSSRRAPALVWHAACMNHEGTVTSPFTSLASLLTALLTVSPSPQQQSCHNTALFFAPHLVFISNSYKSLYRHLQSSPPSRSLRSASKRLRLLFSVSTPVQSLSPLPVAAENSSIVLRLSRRTSSRC